MTSAPPGPAEPRLRLHQQEALTALAGAWSSGRTRAWVALPPGAGKTLVGLLTVRDRLAAAAVGKAVVLGPNTAIQGQWAAQGAALGLEVSTDRSLEHPLTALTYLIGIGGVGLVILPIKILGGVDSFVLLAIPLFILAGALMETGGISERIVDLAVARRKGKK